MLPLNHRCWLELDEVCEVDLFAELGDHLHVGADLPDELLLGLAADHLAQLQRGPQGKPHPLLVHLHTVLRNIRKLVNTLMILKKINLKSILKP